MMENGGRAVVCVTGAGGFVASWLVKLLLSKGCVVHGTVRDPSDGKNAHLKGLEKAAENLKLFKAHLLDYDALSAAIAGCDGVFHVASPVLPSTSVLDPQNWYSVSKTEAESAAFEYAKRSGLDLVTVCPTLVLGPLLQPTVNASSLTLINILKEGYESIENKLQYIVDVRDVVDALLLTYEKPEAGGRYICTAHAIRQKDLVDKLRMMYPNYRYPKSFTDGGEEYRLSREKLQSLGWHPRPLEETLLHSVESYRKAGLVE